MTRLRCLTIVFLAASGLMVGVGAGDANAALSLVEVDSFDGVVYAADSTFLYGRSSASGSSKLARFTVQGFTHSIGYAFGSGKAVTNVWTTSVAGMVFAIVRKNSDATFTLHRSTDHGMTFTQVLVLGDNGSGGQIPDVRILHRGFAEVVVNGSRQFLVGEYNVNKNRVPGGTRDRVRVLRSTNGIRWTQVYAFNTNGIHSTRHIHVVKQDPSSKWIYFGLGDSGSELGIIAWNGVTAWPSQSLSPTQFLTLSGFHASPTNKLRYWVTDILFPPNDNFLYTGMEGTPTSTSTSKENEKGIWRHTRDLASSTRVYPTVSQGNHTGSGIRLGVLAISPSNKVVQLWVDVGNPVTFSNPPPNTDNYNSFYMSGENSFGPGDWAVEGEYELQGSGSSIPYGFLVQGNRIYLSSPLGGLLTRVYEIED